MSSLPASEARQQTLRWLGHGAELAKDRKGERARHSDVIWLLIVDALEIMDRIPDQEKRWLSSGTRSGGWNMVGMTLTELREIERLRVLSGIKPFDGQTRLSPQRDDVDRAMGVLEWLRFCNRARNAQQLVKAGVILARSGETDAVHQVYAPNRKSPGRQLIYEIKTRITGMVLKGLDRQGIKPLGMLGFVEGAVAHA